MSGNDEDDEIFGWAKKLVAERRDLQQTVDALASALERTQTNLHLAINGRPVRDMAENLAENAAALARREDREGARLGDEYMTSGPGAPMTTVEAASLAALPDAALSTARVKGSKQPREPITSGVCDGIPVGDQMQPYAECGRAYAHMTHPMDEAPRFYSPGRAVGGDR